MSVNRTEYVVFGIKFDETKDEVFDKYYEELGDDRLEEKFDPKELSMIYDGMCGKYVVVGYVMAKGDEYEGTDITNVGVDNERLFDLMAELEKGYPELYAKAHSGHGKTAHVGTWAFTHWS
jgi:hypothetical protein